VTRYFFAGGSYEISDDGATQTTKKYYSLGGMMVAMDDGASLKYFATDHLSSSSIVMDDNGTLQSEQRYLPFGEPRQDVSGITETDLLYTNQRDYSYIKLIDFKARWYSPGLMRFTQPDSIVPDFKNPQSLNRYTYTYNSPLIYTDPSGHVPSKEEECPWPSVNPFCGDTLVVSVSGIFKRVVGIEFDIEFRVDKAGLVRKFTGKQEKVDFAFGISANVTFGASYQTAVMGNLGSYDGPVIDSFGIDTILLDGLQGTFAVCGFLEFGCAGINGGVDEEGEFGISTVSGGIGKPGLDLGVDIISLSDPFMYGESEEDKVDWQWPFINPDFGIVFEEELNQAKDVIKDLLEEIK
jgi:RHS repeat-associated protein